MTSTEKRSMERESLRAVIQQWNANRLDLFELSEPDENLQFHGVMRFYFQDSGQKVATKCIRVASDATVADVIETLVEKFRPDMRMLTLPNYALYEVHSNHDERRLNGDEKPLLVQLNWHIDDREGRFLLKNLDQKNNTLDNGSDTIFKRKLSKREKKEQKKKEKLAKLQTNDSENHVAERLYTELPETSFTRSISNPEAVMRRRRQQKLEKKLQQFRSRDGGPDTGGTLKIYGESLCRDVPYKTLLLSIRDCAQAVVREMLAKYGMEKADPLQYCLVQVNSDATEYILDDDECPLSILMNHPTSRGSIMFHVRRRPADSQPRRRKKKPLGVSNGSNSISGDREGPTLVEITHSGDGGRRIKLGSEPIEVGSANTNTLQLFGPSIQPRHCLISLHEGVCTVTPLHADALTFVNGHHIQQPTILHNGSVVMFGRGASYRFVDSPSDGRYNLALSQSQLDSACLYESRSPASPSWHEEDRPLSPVNSIIGQSQNPNHKQQTSSSYESGDLNNQSLKQQQHQQSGFDSHLHPPHHHHHHPSNILGDDQSSIIDDNKSLTTTSGGVGGGGAVGSSDDKIRRDMIGNNNFEMAYDVDGNTETETKSISSVKSSGSNQDLRSAKMPPTAEPGQEPILPAVLEFPETYQEPFLRQVITELDVNAPNFKLAPVYTLYLCARYRASTHYRPDLQPTERAHKLTAFLHHVANIIHSVVQDQYTDPKILSFWMANASEFLHFLKSDRHISAFSVQAQEILAESVQTAFRNLVSCFHAELSQTLSQFMSENIEHEAAATLVLQVLGSAMALLRRCRVNAALTIQLFSQLFHYINVVCFNKIVTTTYMCTAEWGKLLTERLQLLELWAERQGLELAADCHLAKINQCAQFLQAPKSSISDVQQLACSCFKLNSLQMAALLSQETIPRNLIDTAVRMAESVADELTRADGREVRLEESPDLPLALLLPEDGYSSDVVRGIPAGLVDFLSPLQGAGMCRLAAQPTSIGLWTVYMHQYNGRSSSAMSTKVPQPEIQIIKLHKHQNGMGLSIVAAKGAGQERLGIYIKSVVAGGAADLDGRLQAGDQLIRVDGQSLIGITQERAADYLVRTGPVVTLEVAKQGAIYHGLATLLQQPSPVIQRGNRRMSERDMSRIGASGGGGSDNTKPPLPNQSQQQLLNSKSTPALHHVGNIAMSGNKSRSIHNLVGNNNDQGFYQNLSVYRAQNQSQPNLGDRSQMPLQSTINPSSGTSTTASSNTNNHQNNMLSRPASAYFNNSNNSTQTLPSQTSMSYNMMPLNNSTSNTVTNNNNSNISQQQQQQQQQQQAAAAAAGGYPQQLQQRGKPNSYTGTQAMRMNQMMAPSMPNIAHSSGYATNISASQSMQNVNMIAGNYQVNPATQQQQQQQQVMMGGPQSQQQLAYQSEQQQQQQQMRQQAALLRGQAKLAEMGEELKRRHQRQQDSIVMPMTNPMINTNSVENLQGGGMSPLMLSPTGGGGVAGSMKPMMMSPQSQQQQYGMNYPGASGPPGQSNPVKQLPPTAPKPHRMMHHDESQPPLPPTQTHPLFKPGTNQPLQGQQQQQQNGNMNYVASVAEPPKVAYYPVSSSNIAQSKNMIGGSGSGTNPWEREEREKEQEMRREHLRQWRDQQINELSAIPHRNSQQEEQLKTLVLERDFERRALEMEEQEDEGDSIYPKDGVHEMIRLSQSGGGGGGANQSIVTPMATMKQVEIKIPNNTNTMGEDGNSNYMQNYGQQQLISPTSTMQPKSILKHNNARLDSIMNSSPASPSKQGKNASFADERLPEPPPSAQLLNHVIKDIGNMNVTGSDYEHHQHQHQQSSDEFLSGVNRLNSYGEQTTSANIPPPPPERNSSYAIMSQQQQKLRTSTLPSMKQALPDPQSPPNAVPPSQQHPTNNNPAMHKQRMSNNNLMNNNNNNTVNGGGDRSSMLLDNGGLKNGNNNITAMANNLSSPIPPPPLNSNFIRDNKRVSFHDEENNVIGMPQIQMGGGQQKMPTNSMELQQQQQLHMMQQQQQADHQMIREDPNRFIDETQAMLDSPMTPELSETWNSPVQQTPGVIGAQEVYRDPRTRRLQEKQQAQQQKTPEVPEKLSFKEKMKMFALESGENQTPKDKLKISRAQRDIDAVH